MTEARSNAATAGIAKTFGLSLKDTIDAFTAIVENKGLGADQRIGAAEAREPFLEQGKGPGEVAKLRTALENLENEIRTQEQNAENKATRAEEQAGAKDVREAIEAASQYLKGESVKNIGAVPKAMLEELGKAIAANDIDAVSGFNNDILKLLQTLTQHAEKAHADRRTDPGGSAGTFNAGSVT